MPAMLASDTKPRSLVANNGTGNVAPGSIPARPPVAALLELTARWLMHTMTIGANLRPGRIFRWRTDALVALAAQSIDILPGEDFIGFDFVVLVRRVLPAGAVTVRAAELLLEMPVLNKLVDHIDVTRVAAGHQLLGKQIELRRRGKRIQIGQTVRSGELFGRTCNVGDRSGRRGR